MTSLAACSTFSRFSRVASPTIDVMDIIAVLEQSFRYDLARDLNCLVTGHDQRRSCQTEILAHLGDRLDSAMPRKNLSGKKHRASLGEVTLIHPSTLNGGLYRCPLFKLSVLKTRQLGKSSGQQTPSARQRKDERVEKRTGKALQGGISNLFLGGE